MGTTLNDKIAQLDPDHQAEIAAEAERLRAEYLTLKDLRKARELTQVQLAELLGQNQVSIAKLEKRTDILLSTLRRYVEAMGGRLDLVVAFPDRPPVYLDGLGDIDQPSARRKRRDEAEVFIGR
jgi:transcriptional regulator with XRE-family HTH domain